MENLKKTIGPAPSEMNPEELEALIRKEHSRASIGLSSGVYMKKSGKRKSSRIPSKTSMATSLEKKYGMSLEEMTRKLEKLKKLEEANVGKDQI